MYRILGTDQQEYGPVSAEVVLQWIVEGRANASTRVRKDDSTEWKPLSAFPEFAAALTPPPLTMPPPLSMPPPVVAVMDSDATASQILARGYQIDAGCCVSRGWELVKRHFWLTVGACFVVSAISALVVKLVPPAAALISGVLNGGLYFLFLKLVRGGKAEFGDVFAGFNHSLVQLFLAGLVKSLLIGLGMLLCILPGIYLAVAWNLTEALVIDKKLDFWPAMELGRKVITPHWWQLFWLALLSILVTLLGMLACGVGVFIAIPVVIAAWAYAYEDIFGSPPVPSAHAA